jgi:hypothetical protein
MGTFAVHYFDTSSQRTITFPTKLFLTPWLNLLDAIVAGKEAYGETKPMFLRRQGEATRSTPFQPPRRHLGEYKARQGDAISVKNERKGGK